jgi:hypothetical protein
MSDFITTMANKETNGSHSNRRMPCQCNDARPAISIAARTLHVMQDDPNGSLRVTRLNTQIQINHSAAAITVDNQPVMF